MNRTFLKSFAVVFSNLRYIILALLATILFFYIIALIPSSSLIKFFFVYEGINLSTLLNIIVIPWSFFIANSTVLSRSLAITVILLSGINVTMFTYYFKRKLSVVKSSKVGFLGTLTGLLGIGCVSCGSIILSSIFGIGTTTAFLAFLPFNGIEISVVGIIALFFSIYFLAVKIQNPMLCKSDLKTN